MISVIRGQKVSISFFASFCGFRGQSLFQYRKNLRLMGSGDDRVVRGNVNIDLRSDPELSFQINSRLDRKRGSGYQATRIACFEIVDVGAVAMSFFADRVTGPM